MRVQIDHVTRYSYAEPAHGIVQHLKLTPRPTDSQHIAAWRIDIDADGRMMPFTDAHGNQCHAFYADRPVAALTIHVTGTVLTSDNSGIVSGCAEPLPREVYLRQTALTTLSPEIIDLAEHCRLDDRLGEAHALLAAVHGAIAFVPDRTTPATTAAEAFTARSGVCQDMAHVLIAAARHLGLPARYVSGHMATAEPGRHEAAHAWTEIWIENLGWVAFDPAQGLCAGDGHVRVAVGMDALDASPVRGTRRGGGDEALAVSVHGRERRSGSAAAASR
jgi:transglutaminase-like putative cysteine protease